MKKLVLVCSLLASFTAHASTDYIECVGKAFRQPGNSATLASIFTMNRAVKDGAATLTEVVGTVGLSIKETFNTYNALFDSPEIKENTKYKARKYVGYAQFPGIDAKETSGSESGMWGYLVLEKADRNKQLKAHYVFQAGDHLGGTIDYDCKIVSTF